MNDKTARRPKAKHQRLALVVLAIVALVAAAVIATWALRNQASYFYVPSQIVKDPPAPGRAVRLGGMVEKGSIVTENDGVTINFVVGDGDARVPVRYSGIVPDLFIEDSGVVAEGRMQANGTFLADKLLAKHDENYVPRELQAMTAAQKKAAVAETTQ
ncbi:cytochrome c maturation protein CcmE [Tsuneonella sp. YG55]|uniref:Cytochrome c-type biogenesis protein CcmE n=1 Tax=Tsuneonella litorea TaxID=2976475 RepID=A0A9X3A8R6_9SPHN|nr:cytochrome c maturation protein CcmE [Tsuneonella litorea]MCT2559741.1 cytochrome c maturation protein CcmE [Tsuneonella litorea]